ncbi:hypothetical protein [Falsiroseomonas sp. HW251]|uniref:hypothetical protein n=1 Tax=Falsiroseomonas sp. HW251 TaxID=3390998 RepID=UPI003D315250
MRRLAASAALLLASCAQGPTLDQQLSTQIGRSELELVSAWGVPTRTYEVEGRRFLGYDQQRTILMQGPGPYGPRWGWPAAVPVDVSCSITFELRDGRVQGFSHRGQGC